MFASQLHHKIVESVLKEENRYKATFVDKKEVGKFLIEKVYAPGSLLSWDELTLHATGERLNAQAFAADFKE